MLLVVGHKDDLVRRSMLVVVGYNCGASSP